MKLLVTCLVTPRTFVLCITDAIWVLLTKPEIVFLVCYIEVVTDSNLQNVRFFYANICVIEPHQVYWYQGKRYTKLMYLELCSCRQFLRCRRILFLSCGWTIFKWHWDTGNIREATSFLEKPAWLQVRFSAQEAEVCGIRTPKLAKTPVQHLKLQTLVYSGISFTRDVIVEHARVFLSVMSWRRLSRDSHVLWQVQKMSRRWFCYIWKIVTWLATLALDHLSEL